METSALGGSDLKLSLPSLQNGMNAAVFMFPAIRSGRSVKNNVIGLTPVNVSLFVDLSKAMPFDDCTNRKSACFGGSWAMADLNEAREGAANVGRAEGRA